MASRIRLEDRECPLSTTVQHVGEWWTLLILHDAFDGYTRFDQFQESLGISSSMLTTRLKTLVEDGLLERRPYQTNPVRHEYVLTELGNSLRPVIVTLAAWGNSRLPAAERSMILVDAHSGQEVEPVVVDARTGRRLDDSDDYVFAAGPRPAMPCAAVTPRGRAARWKRRKAWTPRGVQLTGDERAEAAASPEPARLSQAGVLEWARRASSSPAGRLSS